MVERDDLSDPVFRKQQIPELKKIAKVTNSLEIMIF